MSVQPAATPTYRIVRHAGSRPGWVVQFHDTDDTYWVSYWDGSRWTKVARQHADGHTEDEVRLQGDGDDAMVVQALELLARRKDVRATARRAAPMSLVVGGGGVVGAAIALVAGAPVWLVLAFGIVGLGGFLAALRWAVRGRGRVDLTDQGPTDERRAEITGDLSENAELGAELGVAIGASVGAVLAVAVVVLALLDLL